jgi:DNA-directed RNA polymerase specialized sigma24 family protein
VREREALDAYVRRTMVNTRTSWWRRRRLDETPVDAPPEPRRTGAERDAGEDLVLADTLRTALDGLPRRQRPAIVLR